MKQWILGLTGGIGSGKTKVSDYFQSLGIAVVDADLIARQVVVPEQPAWHAIVSYFGKDILQSDGTLNRAKLRSIVFANPANRQKLERITHPEIRKQILTALEKTSSRYSILVSPLLFETNQAAVCQRTLLIDVPVAVQIKRTIARDQNTEQQVMAIIDAQMPRENKIKLANDCIDNSRSILQTYQQIDKLHKNYCQMADLYHQCQS